MLFLWCVKRLISNLLLIPLNFFVRKNYLSILKIYQYIIKVFSNSIVNYVWQLYGEVRLVELTFCTWITSRMWRKRLSRRTLDDCMVLGSILWWVMVKVVLTEVLSGRKIFWYFSGTLSNITKILSHTSVWDFKLIT